MTRRKDNTPTPTPAPTPGPAREVTDTDRLNIVMDHVINLTHQLRTLAAILRTSGIDVPETIGKLGPAPDEVVDQFCRESLTEHFPDMPIPWDVHPGNDGNS